MRPALGFEGAIRALVTEELTMSEEQKIRCDDRKFGDNVARTRGRRGSSLTFFLRSLFTPGCDSDLPGVSILSLDIS